MPHGSRYWLEQKVEAWHAEQRELGKRYTILALRCAIICVVCLVVAFGSTFPIWPRIFFFFAGCAAGGWGSVLLVEASSCRLATQAYPKPYLSEDE